MSLTLDQIKKVAKLANLPLTDNELAKHSDQLSKILDYMNKLNEVDTQGVEATFNVTDLFNVMRKDETTPCLPQEKALKNASQTQNGLFVTKGVFEE